MLDALRNRGWPYQVDPALVHGAYIAYGGPASGLRIAISRNGSDGEHDPDDPHAVDLAPLSLSAVCPAGEEATAGDFDWRADVARPPEIIAGQLDAALAHARLARVRGMEAESTVPCPLCGDRYPPHHLLPNSPDADAVCAACIFDGDQQGITYLPYLASEIDELTRSDLAAPTGWDAVAAVLGLCCGRNLGLRADRELAELGYYPVLTARWRDPMLRSWIWLPPRRHRHAAFTRLGAGATIQALVDALDRYKPDIRAMAKSVCRDDGVRWRDNVWNSAVAYAVAFTTQAHERHRHRKPVHVVDSTSDGLSLIEAPFQVSGDALNVEGGLHALLEYLLFPLLLGHGLHDEPREPARQYGATSGDLRPPRQRTDAHVRYSTDRAAQLAVVLGKNPFTPSSAGFWDGPAGQTGVQGSRSSAAPVSERVAKLRDEIRLVLAGSLYDRDGPLHVSAQDAWAQMGWWVPADDSAQAARQAREYLTGLTDVYILSAGRNGAWGQPQWVLAGIAEIAAGGDNPRSNPHLIINDDVRLTPLLLSEIIAVRGPHAIAAGELLGTSGPPSRTGAGSNHPRRRVARPEVAGLRTTGRKHLQMVARSSGADYDAPWAWNSFGLWIPPEDPSAAYDQMQKIFRKCSPEHPATVEILWQSWDDTAPAWYRIHIMEIYSIQARPAMRGFWANPETVLIEIEDVVAVRPSIEGLPLSCTGTASPQFRPSPLRPPAEPQELLPEIMMTQAEAELMISLYLHLERHRLGPLWTTIDAQAAATRDRLMEIVTAAGASGSRTDIDVTVAVRDTSVSQCQNETFDPAPAYTDVRESRMVGLHEVAHAHRDGTVGLEEHGREHLDAVLTCMALYGGSLHLATVPLDGAAVPVVTESLYQVHYDWRCELVEGC